MDVVSGLNHASRRKGADGDQGSKQRLPYFGSHISGLGTRSGLFPRPEAFHISVLAIQGAVDEVISGFYDPIG
jgi:hypothetical protein